jgi:signal transduction histidine kinase/CheY-like chemotaxis protein
MDRAGGDLGQPAPAAALPQQQSPGKSRSLRFRLFLLAASGLVPLALVLLLSTSYLASERKTAALRAALELSRALATAVDAELLSTIALLENLVIAGDLQDLDVKELSSPRFSLLARRVVERQGWRTLLVANERGEVVMRAVDAGNRSTGPVEPDSLAQVLASHQPRIGRLARGPMGQDAFAVRIPVFKDGRLRYVLSAVVPTNRILAVVARQQAAAPTWVLGVFDQEGTRVARSMASKSPRYSASLESLVKASGAEGMGKTWTLEGVESHTGFSRVHASQWVVAVGIPAAEANADFYRLLLAVGAGTVASLALLAWLALRMARSISGPIDALKQAASALGAGQQVELSALGLKELDRVGLALRQAASERDEANAGRNSIEAEREQLLVRLEEALRVAEQANQNKDEFLALLGHELRNPLAPITNAVHLMHLKGDDATAPERTIIQRQLKYVTRLVDDLLDASRIASKRFVINLRALQPVSVLEQTAESLKPMLGGRKLNLEIAPQARALWVRADEARLVQVFNNLLGNAIKFTEANGVLDVRAVAGKGVIEFVFTDNGAGMMPAELARAFELFYQAPNSMRAVNGGLGLGLAIVKSLVEMHSGSIDVSSDGPGAGTAVTLTLCEPPPRDSASAAPASGCESAKVLVVDDNVDAADTLAALLDLSGFQVRVAYAPHPALEIMKVFSPELAILDIGLPGMDGYELAQQLRSRKPPFKGALIALTGYGQQQDVQRALRAGFDVHLTKPVAPEALLQLIAKLLAGTRHH